MQNIQRLSNAKYSTSSIVKILHISIPYLLSFPFPLAAMLFSLQMPVPSSSPHSRYNPSNNYTEYQIIRKEHTQILYPQINLHLNLSLCLSSFQTRNLEITKDFSSLLPTYQFIWILLPWQFSFSHLDPHTHCSAAA